ncbi:MAG: ATP-binding protein, partial [Lentisphaeria bacterium]|nr:ATP-binding protein [Lentisphaeria bacterium]
FLQDRITALAAQLDVSCFGHSSSTRFQSLIENLATKAPVVVLIDEYDKPILNNVLSEEAGGILKVLKGFYSTVKTCGASIRFAFITGVSKFCHVSIFSDLNNLQDITMDARFATLNGYTQRELEANFADWLAEAETRQSLSHEAFMAKVKKWYDGFRFEESAETVYNPVSVAKFLIQGGKFNNYWFATGTPSFLMKLIMERNFNFDKVLSEAVPQLAFEAFEIDRLEALPLLLQTGYLTIRSAEQKRGQAYFRLDFPNLEVGESFSTYLLNAYIGRSRQEAPDFRDKLADAMEAYDLARLRTLMESFFAGISYEIHHKDESNFQNVFFTIFRMLGYIVHAESHTSDGRVDAVVEMPAAVFLFEFKLDGDRSALEQIRRKTYYQSYLATDKRLFLIGCNFSTETGRISDWQAEEYLTSC